MINDDNIITLLAKKDAQAQRELISRYNSRILLYFRMRIKGNVPYEDLAQEVFASFFEGFNRGKVTESKNIAPYIFGIAKRVVFNYYYKSNKADKIQRRIDEEFEVTCNFEGEEKLEQERLSVQINKYIDKLVNIDRLILKEFYFNEKNLGEIADITGKTKHYISVRKERALKKIKIEILKNKLVYSNIKRET